MNTLRKVWAWDGIDYLIQLALICVFAFGALHTSSANQVLTEQGCNGYWHEYNPGVDLSKKKLVNASEAQNLKRGGPTKLNPENGEENNLSKDFQNLTDYSVDKRENQGK